MTEPADRAVLLLQRVSELNFCSQFTPGNVALLSWSAGGSGILLPPLAATFSATAPFTIFVQASLTDCPSNSRQFVTATGQGIATFSFVPDPSGLAWWLSSGT